MVIDEARKQFPLISLSHPRRGFMFKLCLIAATAITSMAIMAETRADDPIAAFRDGIPNSNSKSKSRDSAFRQPRVIAVDSDPNAVVERFLDIRKTMTPARTLAEWTQNAERLDRMVKQIEAMKRIESSAAGRDDGSIARARGMMESIFNNEMKSFNSDLRRLLFEHQQEIIDGWLR